MLEAFHERSPLHEQQALGLVGSVFNDIRFNGMRPVGSARGTGGIPLLKGNRTTHSWDPSP